MGIFKDKDLSRREMLGYPKVVSGRPSAFMIVIGLYIVFDTVADVSGPVYEARNDGVAIRMFRQLVGKSTCPDAFELYYVGDRQFDGTIRPVVRQKVIVPIEIDLGKDDLK